MPGTLTVSGMAAGLASGYKTIGPVTFTGTGTVGAITDVTLASGDNVFTVPPGATFVAVFLGQGPAPTVKVRTNLNSADAGLPISPYSGTGWTAFPLPTGTTSVTLNSTGTLAGVELSFI